MEETKNLKQQYETWHAARALDENVQATLDSPWNAFVCRAVGDVRGKKVLEIACGRGTLALELAARGAEVTAADFSFTALATARGRSLNGGPRFLNADAMNIGLKDASFDIVISCETIEHILSPEAALSEFARVLKPGGTLYLTFPSYLNIYGLYRLYLKAAGRPYNSGVEIQPRENWLFSCGVAALLRKAGFRVRRMAGTGHYLLRPGHMPKNLLPQDENHWANRLLRPFALHAFMIAEKAA